MLPKAVWDSVARRLFLAQSAFGNTALYYHQSAGAIYFASRLKDLLAMPEVPRRPSLLRVAQILTSWSTDGTSTGYEGIFRLPPAHTLTVQDGKLSTKRYWFPENLSPLQLGSDEEYAEAFLEVYGRAVRERLAGDRPVGMTLSGGLDSGSVCALAARALQAQGKRLPVFASVPLHAVEYGRPRSFHDESPYVAATAAHLGNVDVDYIRAESISPLTAGRELLDLLDEPAHGPGNS